MVTAQQRLSNPQEAASSSKASAQAEGHEASNVAVKEPAASAVGSVLQADPRDVVRRHALIVMDFEHGVLEEFSAVSRFFGGALRKFRILSTNRTIQYLFIASPTHAWVNPPQALTTELSTYAVRTLDVLADDDVFVPGYEYHEPDDDPSKHHSQIPAGFAGAPHPDDPARADASDWNEALPVIQEFRARVLKSGRPHSR